MRRVYKNVCPATISASIMAANMWKNSLKNTELDNNKILYEILLDFFTAKSTYFLSKPRTYIHTYIRTYIIYIHKYIIYTYIYRHT